MKNIHRILDPIKKKIFLLIGRAILTAVNNSGKTMLIQIEGLSDEVISDVERMEEYGFASYPVVGTSECVIGFINGNRDHGLVLCIHDREYRPTNLSEGDTRQYDYRGNKITLKSTGIEIEAANGVTIEKVLLGETTKAELVKDGDAMTELQSAISGWIPVPNDGGAALKTALTTFFTKAMADYSSILSEKVRGN